MLRLCYFAITQREQSACRTRSITRREQSASRTRQADTIKDAHNVLIMMCQLLTRQSLLSIRMCHHTITFG